LSCFGDGGMMSSSFSALATVFCSADSDFGMLNCVLTSANLLEAKTVVVGEGAADILKA